MKFGNELQNSAAKNIISTSFFTFCSFRVVGTKNKKIFALLLDKPTNSAFCLEKDRVKYLCKGNILNENALRNRGSALKVHRKNLLQSTITFKEPSNYFQFLTTFSPLQLNAIY